MRTMMAVAIITLAGSALLEGQRPLPVIDMHLHALPADAQGPPPLAICTPIPAFPGWDPAKPYQLTILDPKNPGCADPILSPMTDQDVMTQTIAILERRNIFGVLSGTPERVDTWRRAAPGRFFPGAGLQLGGRETPTTATLRDLHARGRLAVLAEITNQYAGIPPDDPRMEPYWALAEELDIPAGIHVGPGPPGVIHLGAAGYRARLHSALTLEDVLVKHPKLRLYIMHAGYRCSTICSPCSTHIAGVCGHRRDRLHAAAPGVLSLPSGDRRRRFCESRDVRLGPDGVAGCDRPID